MKKYRIMFICFVLSMMLSHAESFAQSDFPNIILVMTDDQGWGQTGYYDHPVLETPNLDAMALNGLRFDRFYAGAPVCSPTRASVLTGRSCVRSGVPSHGHALRKQEKVLATALQDVGYVTGHFGKWHLNGLRGPGVPVFADDENSPGEFGFDTWLTVTNFFDLNPVMSRNGTFETFEGTSSDVIVEEALKFIEKTVASGSPFFSVIWDGSPHAPFRALEEDMKGFEDLDEESRNHYGELVAFDRSLGTLRQGIRDLNIAENTIVWYCSDNGGLSKITPETVGGLRGNKGTIWEGGIRVPAIIEWEGHVKPGMTDYPASTMDIFPTLLDMLGLSEDYMLEPVDGASIKKVVFKKRSLKRKEVIPFRYAKYGALVDNEYKLVVRHMDTEPVYELFNLEEDMTESSDISSDEPKILKQMIAEFEEWHQSAKNSIAGMDYSEGKVNQVPERRFWYEDAKYEDFLEEHGDRPEYSGIKRKVERDL